MAYHGLGISLPSVDGPPTGGERTVPSFKLTPSRIAIIYLVLGFAALLVSDVLLASLFSDPLLARIQMLKGGLEVILTGGLVFALARTQRSQLREVTGRMEHQRNELSMLHRVVRHNLRNDLNIIYGFLGQLESEFKSAGAEVQYEKLNATVEKIESYIHHLNRINKVNEAEYDDVTVDLAEAVPELLATHPAVTEEMTVVTDIPEGTTVHCNHMVRDAVSELVTNAIEHNSAPNPTLRIEVDPDDGPAGMVAMHVTDNGPGMSPVEVQAMETDDESPLLHSTGLGLWFVDWMMTHSGGDLALENHADGTTVTLYFPPASIGNS